MMRKMKFNIEALKKVIWLITLLWIGMIYYFSNQPADISRQASGEVLVQMHQIQKNEIQNISDRRVWNLHYYIRKFAHFVLYCGLGFLLVFSIVAIKYRSFLSYAISWLAASLYAALDEWHQTFVPGRGASFSDIRLDSISAVAGVAVAAIAIEIWRFYHTKRNYKYD